MLSSTILEIKEETLRNVNYFNSEEMKKKRNTSIVMIIGIQGHTNSNSLNKISKDNQITTFVHTGEMIK